MARKLYSSWFYLLCFFFLAGLATSLPPLFPQHITSPLIQQQMNISSHCHPQLPHSLIPLKGKWKH
uniref:Uncharacterized protein n=1 Tax=Salix viminalis TaxID=40686 RepID=A0A6N2M3Y2_SALVM